MDPNDAASAISTLDFAQLGIVMGVVFGLFELLKFTIGKALDRNKANGHTKLSNELYELIRATGDGVKQLLKMHGETDEDGRPKWYFPTSVTRTLESVGKSLDRQASAQERMGRVLDALERRISTHESDLDQIKAQTARMARCPFAEGPSTVAVASGESGTVPIVRRQTNPGIDPTKES